MGKSQALYRKAKTLIPGGAQLLSKRPELFLPDFWPAYYEKAKGCEVWDLDGNKYIDMITMGIGACILGYADDDVNRAVKEAIDKGSMSSLNPHEEVALAELLCEIHPWAEMVRFCRSGGESMSISVRIARAHTKKDKVLFCGYHGWHDWYLSANLAEKNALDGHLLPGLNPLGVPRTLKGLALPFNYNDTVGFLKLVRENKGQIGAIVLETIRNDEPKKDFVEAIAEIVKKEKIIFIVDEITSGWRLNLGGAHLLYDLKPDIAVFAKGISNGYPMAAVVGKAAVMSSAQESFISSTYWTERVGPVAALATINKMKTNKVQEYLIETGKRIQSGWREKAEKNGLEVHVAGIFPLSHFDFLNGDRLVLKTLFTQFMLEKGFLASTLFYASYAHREPQICAYLNAVDAAFAFISSALKTGSPEKFLKGPVCHSGFKRLN